MPQFYRRRLTLRFRIYREASETRNTSPGDRQHTIHPALVPRLGAERCCRYYRDTVYCVLYREIG